MIRPATYKGKPVYVYADPTICGCLYMGGTTAYNTYISGAMSLDMRQEYKSEKTDTGYSPRRGCWTGDPGTTPTCTARTSTDRRSPRVLPDRAHPCSLMRACECARFMSAQDARDRPSDQLPVISFSRPKKARLRFEEMVQSTGSDWKPSSKRSRLMR